MLLMNMPQYFINSRLRSPELIRPGRLEIYSVLKLYFDISVRTLKLSLNKMQYANP